MSLMLVADHGPKEAQGGHPAGDQRWSNAVIAHTFNRETAQTLHVGTEFVSSQGAVRGRAELLRLALGTECIQVGGMSVTCIDGQLRL